MMSKQVDKLMSKQEKTHSNFINLSTCLLVNSFTKYL